MPYAPDAEVVLRQLQANKTLKKYQQWQDGVPDFMDTTEYGELVNDHDYLARYMAMTVPGFWASWMEGCWRVMEDNDRITGVFSGNDVGMEVRRKIRQERVGAVYKVPNARTAYLMRLATRSWANWRDRVAYRKPRRLLGVVNTWLAAGNIPRPQKAG